MERTGSLGCVVCLALVGCGAPLEDESLGEVQSELVSGARRVTSSTSNPANDPTATESEAVVNINEQSGQGAIRTITYNADDPAFIAYTSTTRTINRNASMLGWSWAPGTSTTFTHNRVRPPAGWAVLWGDPAIGQAPGTPSVFISNLAIPDSKFPAGGITGPINDFLGGACIARSADGGKNFTLTSADCFSNASHFYDGGAITGTYGTGPVFAAYIDTVTDKIDVWRADTRTAAFQFEQVSAHDPFPGKEMGSHPRLKYFNGNLYVAAVDTAGDLWVNTRSTSPQAAWLTPFKVANNVVITVADNPIFLQSGLKLRASNPFAWDVGKNEAGGDELRVLTRRLVNGKHFMTGWRCTYLNVNSFLCSGEPVWSTESRGTASFMGTVAYSAVVIPNTNTTRAVWKASWFSETSNGKVAIEHANMFVSPAKRFDVVPRVTGEQTPCPDNRGFWGDYDDMRVLGSGISSTTSFFRPFSDSTGEACVPSAFTSRPLHLSEVMLSQDGNVAYNRSATASSVYPDNTHPASHAFDANLNTYWASINTAGSQWIRIDLGATRVVNRVKLNWGVRYARGYTLETSPDGVTWTARFTTATGDGNIDDITGLGGLSVRYLRLNMSNPFGSGYSLVDFEVHGY